MVETARPGWHPIVPCWTYLLHSPRPAQPPPQGPRVGVVTNAGGPGILLADACEAQGLTLPELTAPSLLELRSLLPAAAGFANPIDMIASATPEQYERAIEIVGSESD